MYNGSISAPNECRALSETIQSKMNAAATDRTATLETEILPEGASLCERRAPDTPTRDHAAAWYSVHIP